MGKADMEPIPLQMSAYDPKRTLVPLPERQFLPIRCPVVGLGGAMRRREFITLLGGMVTAWPRAVQAQQGERMRRMGVLTSGAAADDPDGQIRSAAFLQELQHLGWTDGRNIRFDCRWG